MAATLPAASGPAPTAWRSVRAVLTVQTQNAFNDNVVRFALMGIAFVILQDNPKALDSYKNLIGALISLPFVLFAPIAGWASDRYSKRQVILACLYAQIAIIGAIIGAILIGHLWLATAGFFVLAIQSAFFGPAKLGIMKELVGSKKLAAVSGWMQMLTIVAIVFGSPAGGGGYQWARTHLTADPWLAGLFPVGIIALFSVVALFVVRRVEHTPPHHAEPLSPGVFFRHFSDVREVYRSRPVWLSSIGIAFFWFSGAYAIAVFTQIAQEIYSGETAAAVASYALAATGLGIMIGSVFVALLSSNRIELGLVPLGALGMGLSLFLATFFPPGLAFYLALVALGATSAIFLVPQNAYLQDKADPNRRGRVLSASNLINSIAALGANGAQLLMQRAGASSDLQLWLLGLLSIAAALYSLRMLPSNFVRVLLKMLLRLLYRLRAYDEDRIPPTGGALLLANHVTWIDGLLIGAACSRDVRFVAYEGFFRRGPVGWGLRLFGVIPISSTNARHALKTTAAAINDGHLVCLFPEGTLTRTGCLNELQKGFELIIKLTGNAPVIPVYLDRLWGSVFSFSESKFFFKRPQRLPYAAAIHFGEPLAPENAQRDRVRQALLALGRDAYGCRPELHVTLAHAAIDALKRHPRRPALLNRSHSRATPASRHTLLTTAWELGRRWQHTLPDQRVAVALPYGTGAVMAHLGLLFAGKTAVPLPLSRPPSTAGRPQKLAKTLRESGVTAVITSTEILEECGQPWWPSEPHLLHQDLDRLQGFPLWKTSLRLALTPKRWLKRCLHPALNSLAAPETEAVCLPTIEGDLSVLTHRQLLTQVAQLSDTNILGPNDVILNTYPVDHIAGQLFGLWLPLLRDLPFVVPSLGPNRPSSAALLHPQGVTVLVTDASGLAFFAPALEDPDSAVQLLATADLEQPTDPFLSLQSKQPDLFVSRFWADPLLNAILSMDIPLPLDAGITQKSRKEGASGRFLPGIQAQGPKPDQPPGPFLIHQPASQLPESAGAPANIDDAGFLFPAPL